MKASIYMITGIQENENPKELRKIILTLENFILNFFQVLFVMLLCSIMFERVKNVFL